MSTNNTFHTALNNLLVEIFNGPPEGGAYILNPGDPGLLRQLDTLDAKAASTRPMPGATTIAAHADHVHYGLSLLNRWAAGEENPFETADWEASWKRTTVTEDEWKALRAKLRQAADSWRQAAAARTEWNEVAAAGALGSASHTAYHLGAIRQIIAAQKR